MTSEPHRVPLPAYQATEKSPLHANRELYTKIGATTSRELTDSFVLPVRSGRAWTVPAGHICRISTPEGPQVGDLNIWSLHNPRERFWAARTRQLHRSHVTTFDRLWSCLPYLRPLVTITADSLVNYGVDGVGGRVHDLLGTRCDPYGRLAQRRPSARVTKQGDVVNKMLTGDDFDFHCHSNLTRAVMPWGLAESDVHDVLNVFQVTGLNKDGQYFMEPCPAKPGDSFEFFAEIDILCALSTCPGGDLSTWGWGEGRGAIDMLDCCRPLGVEVYKITDPAVLEGWKPPTPPEYKGLHGVALPTFKKQ